MRLQGKVCLITGAAAGIGRATAEKFKAEGATVAVCDLVAVDDVRVENGPWDHYARVNVADRAAVDAWVTAVLAEYGRIDVLVNNAGITRDAQLVKYKNGDVVGTMSEEAFDLVIAVSFLFCALSGVYFLFAPSGGYQGGQNLGWDPGFLLNRTAWDLIHTWSGVLLIIAAVLHFAIHWRWVRQVTVRFFLSLKPQASEAQRATTAETSVPLSPRA